VTEEVANEGMAIAPDGYLLAEHYEALRRQAVDASEYPTNVRGLAILMRRGMAAWMKCMRELPVHVLSPATSVVANLPDTLEKNLIDIMATMAFATAMGVSDESRGSFESTTAAPEEERVSVRAAIVAATGVRKQREYEASV
jgi:hypothetical protein